MEFIGEGCPVNEIGRAVDASIRRDGFKPIANLTGHEIKKYNLHSGLAIPNVNDNSKTLVRAGMILAVEPFATNGGGLIRSARPGNIYKISQERPIADPELKDFYDTISKEFVTFPFTDRWCDHPKAGHMISKLVRHGLVTMYSQLVEVKKGCVTQSEHTVYIDGKNATITTLI